MQESENNDHPQIHAFESETLELETLRQQNTDLRRRLTAALEASGVSKTALDQAQAFERIGRDAAGAAHDFSNFVTGIQMVLSELYEVLGPQSPHADILAIAMSAAQKAGAVSKRLLSQGRRKSSKQALNLNQVIRGMSSILRRLLGMNIDLDLHLDDSLSNIEADQTQMEQLILNLAVNARDAMPAGGKLTIETWNETEFRLGHRPSIKLAVSDTGVGMDAPTRSRIFEPFFTTKGADKGTGLGLATLKGIVEEHAGEVSVVSEPQRGSRFTILLPLAA